MAAAKKKPTSLPRWRCPHCKSTNVQISLPTWFHETQDGELQMVEPDAEAEILWWYCEDCDETDSDAPEPVMP